MSADRLPTTERPPAVEPTRTTGRRLAAAVALLVVLAALLLGPGSAVAGAQSGDERILAYTSDLRLDGAGLLSITETIDWRFPAGQSKQGIFRYIPIRVRYDDRQDRVDDPRDIRVTATPLSGNGNAGAAAAVTVADDDQGNRQIRIGTQGNFITGTWRYTISYTVAHTVEAIEDVDAHYQELAWNAVGTGWPAPIDVADVTFTGPATILNSTCFVGAAGSTHGVRRLLRRRVRPTGPGPPTWPPTRA